MSILVSIALILVGAVLGLQVWRWRDARHSRRVWEDFVERGVLQTGVFDSELVANLPEPARRFFLFTIKDGAPLRTVAEIRMTGELGLGTQKKPNYQPMLAEQILAPPTGLVWKLSAGRGVTALSGSDGMHGNTSWVRFWLMKIVPVVRAGGSADHLRSAFGRVVAESVFWAPAALLPGNDVAWEAVGPDVARATVRHNGMTQSVDITIAEDGRPTMVVIPRWTDANPEKTYQLQPFGGFLSEFREFQGYRLPTRVEGGNLIGTSAYFPFYKARVADLRFVDSRRHAGVLAGAVTADDME